MATYQQLADKRTAAQRAYEQSDATTRRLLQEYLDACNEASTVFAAENDDLVAFIEGLGQDKPVAPYGVAYIAQPA